MQSLVDRCFDSPSAIVFVLSSAFLGETIALALKLYDGKDIRNVGAAGHGGSGKTSLVSALLYTAGSVNRFGTVGEGNTVTDFDEEEIARKVSISTGVAYAEWGGANKVKLNLLDTPGYNIFINEDRKSVV